jgi:hypothetical protein
MGEASELKLAIAKATRSALRLISSSSLLTPGILPPRGQPLAGRRDQNPDRTLARKPAFQQLFCAKLRFFGVDLFHASNFLKDTKKHRPLLTCPVLGHALCHALCHAPA